MKENAQSKMRKALGFIRRNKLATKLISFFLSLVLVFYVIPSTIYAEAAELFSDDGAADGIPSDEASSQSADTSGDLLLDAYEDESLREESVKHFHLSDGSYIAAQYNYPVHYADENGRWQDIDNALVDSGSEYANSNARIKFAKKITGNESQFTLHDGSTKITMSLIGASKGTVGEVTNNEDSADDTELQKMMSLEKISSSILYRDILDGVDLEYVAYSQNVKENIIVKERSSSYSYSFEFNLNGLTPTLTENGDIHIADGDGKIKYTIPAPVVFDASGAYAPQSKASYTLEYKNGKKYILTLSVDSSWMNADERVFPVTVDPAIVSANTALIDTYIDSSSPSARNSAAITLQVSYNKFAYVKSSLLPSIPDSAYISSASVRLFEMACFSGRFAPFAIS